MKVIEAPRAYAVESAARSWWALLSTTAMLAGCLFAVSRSLVLPVRLALSALAGLLIVREFILYHDHMHGALLRGSTLARCVLYPFAILVMTPPGVWRESIPTRRWHGPRSRTRLPFSTDTGRPRLEFHGLPPLLLEPVSGSLRSRADCGAGGSGLGTAAKTRVLIESSDGATEWGTIGVHDNIIEASLQALADSLEYGLLTSRVKTEK